MTKSFFIGLALVFASVGVRADVLTLGSVKKQDSGVNIYNDATINITGHDQTKLTGVAEALRQKTVIVITKDIYVAQLLVADSNAYGNTKTAACQSHTADAQLKALPGQQKTVAVRLDFKYSVTAAQFDGAFRDSWNENKIDWNAPALTQFLDAVNAGGDVGPKKSWTLVIESANGKDVLTFQDAKGKVTTITDADLMRRIMALWMGTPTSGDSGLENFVNNFLCGN